jgi:hypothetical protein
MPVQISMLVQEVTMMDGVPSGSRCTFLTRNTQSLDCYKVETLKYIFLGRVLRKLYRFMKRLDPIQDKI